MNKTYKYCLKQKKLVAYSAHCDVDKNIKEKENVKIDRIFFDGDKASVLTESGAIYKQCNEFFIDLPAELSSLNLTEEKYKQTINLIKNVVEQTRNVCLNLAKKKLVSSEITRETIESGSNHTLRKLSEIDSALKLKKNIEKHPLFVKPIEKAIGLKWKNAKVDSQTQVPDHGLVQTTFQYVPILQTLNAVFQNDYFRDSYLKYNLHQKHKCEKGVYKHFCCGSIYQSNAVFEHPLALQLQIGTDDFEVCCPIKSKATKHKVNATYVQILNLPVESRSKLMNIFLVALCGTANFKSHDYNYDHIAELIVDEIRILETDGIKVGSNIIKRSLANVACDNLGAMTVFGFAEGFNTTYFCRHCECSKSECQRLTKEKKEKLRNKQTYANHLKIAENSIKLDLAKSKGIKRSCKFNELHFFHILDNMSIDLMHDANEGLIPYCLHDFFELVMKKKIIAADEIAKRVRDFNYGSTDQRNKPSLINFDKVNLNQNASQLHCLMRNIPFIFWDMKDTFGILWQPIESLLKCMQIIYSTTIYEHDIKTLEMLIDRHLSSTMEIFGRKLTPKQHFLIHYPEYIRKMGPPIHLWTMRLESKHKVLTEIGRAKMNFINLPKTLATQHQQRICKRPILETKIAPSKVFGSYSKSMQFSKYESIIKRDIGSNTDQLHVHKFASFGSITYREGNLIIENGRIYEIINILSIESNVFLLCEHYKVLGMDDFYNSILIERSSQMAIALNFETLQNKPIYDKIYAADNYYIIAETLKIAKLC